MRVQLVTRLFVIALAVIMLTGCGEVPQTDIDAAQAALDAAKQAEADKYVPDMYNAAKNTLDNALAIVEEEKSGMFSNYDEAVVQLEKAKNDAQAATEAVPAKKEELKREIDGMVAQIPDMVNETKALWKRAPRGKGTREPLQLIKNDIEATEKSVDQVTTMAEQGDLLGAQKKAQDIMNKLRQLQSELQ
jgi:hypothetical protein